MEICKVFEVFQHLVQIECSSNLKTDFDRGSLISGADFGKFKQLIPFRVVDKSSNLGRGVRCSIFYVLPFVPLS
jgi:hypothetical protein